MPDTTPEADKTSTFDLMWWDTSLTKQPISMQQAMWVGHEISPQDDSALTYGWKRISEQDDSELYNWCRWVLQPAINPYEDPCNASPRAIV